MPGLLADAVLVAAILAVAGATVAARRAFTATALFIPYGLLLALAWVRLGAVDIALTEAAIGAGLSGVLLLGAASRLRAGEAGADPGPGRATKAAIALGCAAVTAALAAAVLLLPAPAPSLAPQVAAALPTTGMANPVTGVLMSFRALDTLLESAVLVLAVLGVWSLAPDGAWGGVPGPRQAIPPDGGFVLLARILPPIGIVVAVHILWVGADAPGGKFQAAAILAAMWILAWMAGLVVPARIASRRLRGVLALGPLVFLGVGALGLVAEGAFLAYPPGWAKPLILVIEFALTASVAVALALLVMGPPEEQARP